jgi:hypothetical protein
VATVSRATTSWATQQRQPPDAPAEIAEITAPETSAPAGQRAAPLPASGVHHLHTPSDSPARSPAPVADAAAPVPGGHTVFEQFLQSVPTKSSEEIFADHHMRQTVTRLQVPPQIPSVCMGRSYPCHLAPR